MMSLRQKMLAFGVIFAIDFVLFLFAPIFGVAGFVVSLPLAFAILKR